MIQHWFKKLSLKIVSINALHIFNDGIEASMLLLLPFIASDTGITLFQVGILGALANVFGIALALQTGRIVATVGGLRALIFAMVAYSLGLVIAALSQNFAWLVVAFGIGGVGFGIFHPIAFSLVARWAPAKTRGRTMGNFTATGEIGKVALPGIITMLIVGLGWRIPALLYAAAGLVLATALYWLLRPRNGLQTTAAPAKTAQTVPWRTACNTQFVLTATAAFFDCVASASLFVFLPFLLLERGIDPALLGSLVALFFIGSFVGKIYIGKLVDKFGSGKVFIVTDLLMMVFIVLLANATWLPLIVTFAVILGVFTKGTPPILQTMVLESAESHGNFEKAFGLNTFISSFAITLAPLLLGWVSHTLGIVWAFYCMAAAAFVAVVPAWAFYRLQQRRTKPST